MVLCYRPLTVGFQVLPAQRYFHVLVGLKCQYRPEDGRFRLPKIFAVGQVHEPAIVIVTVKTDPGPNGVTDGPGNAGHRVSTGAAVSIRVAIDSYPSSKFKLVRWPLGIDQHSAAGHVAAEQRALRATQYFDAVNVKHVQDDSGVLTNIDPVDKDTYGRVDGRDRRVDAQATY